MRKYLQAFVPVCSLILLFSILFFSCKKTDQVIPVKSGESEIEKQFFKEVQGIDPIVYAVKESIRRHNNSKKFIEKYVGYAGYPIWEAARINYDSRITTANKTTSENDKVIYIPFAKPENEVIGAILEVWINETDTVYNTIYHWQYDQYGFEPAEEYYWDAKDIFNLFAGFQNSVYNNSKFRINDGRLLDMEKDQQLILTLQSRQQTSLARFAYAIEECVVWDVCIPYLLAKSSSMAGDPMCYQEFQIEICTTYFFEIGGGGEGGGGGGSGGGGGGEGGGGGGGGGDPWGDPCRPIPGFENPCGGIIGWTPIDDDIRDPNGFLYSRIAELEQKIAQDPYTLLECDELNIMPLEDQGNGFGKMYKRIAQFNPPQSIVDRLEELEQTTLFNYDDFYVQDIDDASGSIVNCDFFAVRIQQLPTGWTTEMLVEHFRTNINSFIASPINVSFDPYVGNGIDDTQLWNSVYEASLGSLVSIHINALEEGSVVLSDYFRNPLQNNHRFNFTTIATPSDWAHPVSGNREFGIYQNPAAPGEYAFYIMGVDRASGPVFALFENLIFSEADELWQNIQTNMVNFINNLPGGQAGTFSNGIIKARPKWEDVREYLRGEIDWDTLKQRLGC